MKLLFVISQFYAGGAEKSLLNLLKKLDKSKYDIDLIIMNQSSSGGQWSLVSDIPKDIHVVDAWKQMCRFSLIRRIKEGLLLTKSERYCDPASALLYARGKEYDWAFHVGEWWPPAFTALKVRAKHKAAWIHNDISRAEYFNEDDFFKYDNKIDRYIFVSNNSMSSSLEAFPFIRDKSSCIYNINDVISIRKKAGEDVQERYFEKGLPVIVTCANIRQQKNHARQLEAMVLLKKRGVDFIWLNIGSTVETDRCEKLLLRAKELGLEDRFILAGAKENPYKYMSRADAVTVLSDYESWSMVITEAKILGIPVIATKTSGALEQIEDGETGLLTNFSTAHIAEQIEKFLCHKDIGKHISSNLKDFDNTNEILTEFDNFVETGIEKKENSKKELLYIIDDINYQGGAHIATKLQIQEFLREGRSISIFSSSLPTAEIRTELDGVTFLSWMDFFEDRLYNRRLLDCLFDPALTGEEKKYKIGLTWEGKFKQNTKIFKEKVFPYLSHLFAGYKTICVMSESSAFREVVANTDCKHRVQWIHIDYCQWRVQDSWTQKITAHDGELYRKYDNIVVLTPGIKDSMAKLYPHLESKIVVNPNIIPVETVRKKAELRMQDENYVHFVTVGRIEEQKAYDRLYQVLQRLYDNDYRFYWTIIGGGNCLNNIQKLFSRSTLRDYVTFTGSVANPFPMVKEADVFALLSQYEGLPNTIFESLILGTPVIATDVGGVSTQVKDGQNGWLVQNDEESIYSGLEHILSHPEEIARVKENLKSYEYDNKRVLLKARQILFGQDALLR